MRKLAIFVLLSLIAHLIVVAEFSLPVWRQAAEPPPAGVELEHCLFQLLRLSHHISNQTEHV